MTQESASSEMGAIHAKSPYWSDIWTALIYLETKPIFSMRSQAIPRQAKVAWQGMKIGLLNAICD